MDKKNRETGLPGQDRQLIAISASLNIFTLANALRLPLENPNPAIEALCYSLAFGGMGLAIYLLFAREKARKATILSFLMLVFSLLGIFRYYEAWHTVRIGVARDINREEMREFKTKAPRLFTRFIDKLDVHSEEEAQRILGEKKLHLIVWRRANSSQLTISCRERFEGSAGMKSLFGDFVHVPYLFFTDAIRLSGEDVRAFLESIRKLHYDDPEGCLSRLSVVTPTPVILYLKALANLKLEERDSLPLHQFAGTIHCFEQLAGSGATCGNDAIYIGFSNYFLAALEARQAGHDGAKVQRLFRASTNYYPHPAVLLGYAYYELMHGRADEARELIGRAEKEARHHPSLGHYGGAAELLRCLADCLQQENAAGCWAHFKQSEHYLKIHNSGLVREIQTKLVESGCLVEEINVVDAAGESMISL